MRRPPSARCRPSDAGFTLAEMLVVVAVLGIIGYGITESVFLGLKTTNSTANRVSGNSAMETLNSYFFGDVQSADQVSTTTTSTSGTACGTFSGVVVHLSWTDQTVPTDVFYTFDPATGGDQNLLRTKCTGSTDNTPPTVDNRILGHFTHDPALLPVRLLCGTTVTPATPCAVPSAVTLELHSDPAAPVTDLTAVRRRSP